MLAGLPDSLLDLDVLTLDIPMSAISSFLKSNDLPNLRKLYWRAPSQEDDEASDEEDGEQGKTTVTRGVGMDLACARGVELYSRAPQWLDRV